MFKGRKLDVDDATLEAIHIDSKSRLMLIGTAPEQLREVANLDKKLEANRQTAQRFLANRIKPARPVTSTRNNKYTFHRISVIEEFPNPEAARKLLERLRDDRGIRGIMNQRQWSVGELSELTPFERSILGYNRNAGELISIRLRTDDLSGFRTYDSIRKVLLHELTHNVWGDHDDNFHALNRQLNKDVVSLDWTAHGGHVLSSGSYYDADNDVDNAYISYEAGAYRLGGNSSPVSTDARELRAIAAVARLTKQEEQELDEGCGSSHAHTN
ncbi:WLM domain-containing protein [Dichotomocladium elegans]|nr:WLM domain-containing protein [Dichotomocladium elegans]